MSEPLEEECSPRPAPFRGSAPFLRIAPPLSVPMRHFAVGALAYPSFAAALFWGAGRLTGFGFDARFALGLTHVLTLGWAAQTILGAWTQMIPVHGEVPLASVRAAKAAWWLFTGGAVSFVAILWGGGGAYWPPAAALLAGALLYIGVLGATLTRSPKRDWTRTHFQAALFWLACLAAAGVLMAVDRQRGMIFADPEGGLIAHVHMALIGFVATTIFGAGYRLFPWVALHQMRSRVEGRASFLLIQCGLAGLALDALFFGRALMPLWACLLSAGYLAYLLQFRPLLTGGAAFDPSLALVLLGLTGGGLWAGLGLGLAFGRFPDLAPARAAYAFTALVGCVTPIILSQAHKIAPFLVWLHVYSPRQWTPPVVVPKIDDLTNRGLAWVEFFALAAAIPSGAAGFLLESELLLRASGALLLASACAYLANSALTLRHVVRPDGRWTPPGVQERTGS